MVRHTETDDEAKFDDDARSTLRNADVERGDTVRVVVDPEADFDHIIGEVTAKYNDGKWAIQVDGETPDGKAYIVNENTKTVRVGNHRDGFEEVDARPVYVTPRDDTRDVDTDETLVFDHTTHGAHEKTGKSYTRTKTKRHDGEVYQEEGGLIGFRTPEHDGVFFVLPDGTVEYDPHDPDVSRYEVGTNGRIDE